MAINYCHSPCILILTAMPSYSRNTELLPHKVCIFTAQAVSDHYHNVSRLEQAKIRAWDSTNSQPCQSTVLGKSSMYEALGRTERLGHRLNCHN